ncbi:MAG TPA: hypothetical protein VE666_11145 [Mycobacterium sp.]|nr:hypothetical protein [Mycobacterium sp.]
MATLAITIQTPPVGELENSGDGSNPTDVQMQEEQAARDNMLKALIPFLQSLPQRPPHRAANVTGFDLLGANSWSRLNNYLLLLNTDIGQGGLVDELSEHLPEGSQVSMVGEFVSIESSRQLQTETPTV